VRLIAMFIAFNNSKSITLCVLCTGTSFPSCF